MEFRYRITGKIVKPFILRGLFYKIGVNINSLVTEKELDFVKDKCELTEIVDLSKQVETDNPIPKVLDEKASEVKNELPKQTKRTTKTTSKKNI